MSCILKRNVRSDLQFTGPNIPNSLSKVLSVHPAGLYFFTFTVNTTKIILSTVAIKGLNIWSNFS